MSSTRIITDKLLPPLEFPDQEAAIRHFRDAAWQLARNNSTLAYAFLESNPTPMQVSIAENATRVNWEHLEEKLHISKVRVEELRRATAEQSKKNTWEAKKAALFMELEELGIVVQEGVPTGDMVPDSVPTRTYATEAGSPVHANTRSSNGRLH